METFGEWYEVWLDNLSGFREAATCAGYASIGRKLGDLHKMHIAEIKPMHVQRILREITPGRHAHARTVISQVFEYAEMNGVEVQNPTTKLKLARPYRKEKPPSVKEVARVIAVAGEWKAFVATAAYSGLRFGELVALRWGEVDLRAGKIRVERAFCSVSGEVKGPKSRSGYRTVTIGPQAVAALKGLKRGGDHELVFPNRAGKPLNASNWNNYHWRRIKREAGVDFKFKNLRNFYGSVLVEGGVSITRVQRLMGHSRASTTLDCYADVLPDEGEDGIQKILGNS